MNNLSLILILVYSLSSCFTINSQISEYVKGKINVVKQDNFVVLKAQVENEELLFKNDLFYNLVALKKGSSGNYSSNNESGEFSLDPNESKNLSTIRLNIEKNEQIQVYLFIKHKDVLVSRDSVLIMPTEQKKIEKKDFKEEEFILKGIVIDEVITKIGKDFHDYFYQSYRASGVQHPFIITLKEKPYFGRSSIITILVEETKIFEFMTKPDEEFLKIAVMQSLQNLNTYAIQRKLLFTKRI
jgi:hypothetical protein